MACNGSAGSASCPKRQISHRAQRSLAAALLQHISLLRHCICNTIVPPPCGLAGFSPCYPFTPPASSPRPTFRLQPSAQPRGALQYRTCTSVRTQMGSCVRACVCGSHAGTSVSVGPSHAAPLRSNRGSSDRSSGLCSFAALIVAGHCPLGGPSAALSAPCFLSFEKLCLSSASPRNLPQRSALVTHGISCMYTYVAQLTARVVLVMCGSQLCSAAHGLRAGHARTLVHGLVDHTSPSSLICGRMCGLCDVQVVATSASCRSLCTPYLIGCRHARRLRPRLFTVLRWCLRGRAMLDKWGRLAVSQGGG